MILTLLNILFLLAYIVLLIYYRFLWNGVPEFSRDKNHLPQTFVTVVIPVRNEEKNILRCLESVTGQHYPAHLFEILVVDDYSEDRTVALAQSVIHPALKLISLAEEGNPSVPSAPGKKKAISRAVDRARGELIITTDADCNSGQEWISTIVNFYEKFRPGFIAAPVRMKNNGEFTGIFQSLDFLTLQGIGAAAVHHRFHLLSNGANLAYEKKLFQEVGGFEGIDKIASGDDLLLMHKMAAKKTTAIAYCLSKDAIVNTGAEPNLQLFLQQRIRWASKARFYPDIRISAVLLLVFTLNILLIALLVTGFFYPVLLIYWLILIAAKTGAELFFLFPVADFFDQKKLLRYFIVSQPIHLLYTVVAGFFGQISTYSWKGRRSK